MVLAHLQAGHRLPSVPVKAPVTVTSVPFTGPEPVHTLADDLQL